MGNLTVTNVDVGSVIQKNAQFRDELLIFGGAGTVVEGALLARQTVDLAVANGVADGGNTGDGTVTVVSVVPGTLVPISGAWILNCTTAIVAHEGVFELIDPNGSIISSALRMTAGSGGANVFEVGGLIFTITDGGTDFAVDDFFTLTVVANGKMIPFAIAGAGGAQLPVAILTFDVTAADAGDEAIRAGVSGSYRKERLIIDADGDGSNITDAILDQLRDYSLIPIDVQELNKLDNQ